MDLLAFAFFQSARKPCKKKERHFLRFIIPMHEFSLTLLMTVYTVQSILYIIYIYIYILYAFCMHTATYSLYVAYDISFAHTKSVEKTGVNLIDPRGLIL